jgi:DNA-binding GntR family transcriptional regulator
VKPTLMRQAHDEIKRRIITLELQPGQRLDDNELSAQLELSRTPVREALFLLGSEGLVEIREGIGFSVRPLDLMEIAELFEAHIVAAKAVARLAASRLTEADLESLRSASASVDSALDRHDHLEIARSNAQLHRVEADIARNRYLRGVTNELLDQGERLAYLCFGGEREWGDIHSYYAEVKQDHAALLEAYANRAPEVAEVVAAGHVKHGLRRVQAWMSSEAIDGFRLSEVDLPPDLVARNLT